MNQKKSILIIDDDSRNIFALSAVLRSRGYECKSATNAGDGMKILSDDSTVGVVLLDMMMPEMDGYETMEQIRGSAHFGQIPVIAVTARAMTGDREKCLEAGTNEYISKPVDVDTLVHYLERYLKN